MPCLCCRLPTRGVLCTPCRSGFRPAPDRLLPGGLGAHPAFVHEGPARRLVHRLKYEGLVEAAMLLAGPMAHRLPVAAVALVPIPRVRWRRLRYGIDPAATLAALLGRLTGLPVVDALTPSWTGPVHAGRRRGRRRPPRFGRRVDPGPGVVLIDDVVTTGITIVAAAKTVGGGVAGAVTATGAVTSLIGDGAV